MANGSSIWEGNPVVDFDPTGQTVNAADRPSTMQAFRNRVEKFWQTFNNLQAKENEVPSHLRDEYNNIMERGGTIRQTVETLTNTYDAVAEWLSDIFGLNGADMGLDGVMYKDALRGNLGAVQFVPLAIIVSSSAFIVKWLKDAYTMERKLNEYQRLQNEGYSADRAAEIVEKTITGPGFLNLGVNMKPLLWAGGIVAGLWYANRKGWI